MDNILLRSAKYYEDLKVDIILSTRVESVDVEHKTLMRQDGVETAFDKLFIATGCNPKRLSPEIPGKKLIFFFYASQLLFSGPFLFWILILHLPALDNHYIHLLLLMYMHLTLLVVQYTDYLIHRLIIGQDACKPLHFSFSHTFTFLLQIIPGISDASSNIFHLRTIADLEEIREALTKQTDLVVVGSSYLGAEIAATCSQQVKTVTIVSDTAYPFQNVFGMVVGRRMAKLCTEMGINMRMSTEIVQMEIHPDTWSLAGVVLKDGALVPAQMLIVCIGVTYATEFLVDSGVALTEGGAVKVTKSSLSF